MSQYPPKIRRLIYGNSKVGSQPKDIGFITVSITVTQNGKSETIEGGCVEDGLQPTPCVRCP